MTNTQRDIIDSLASRLTIDDDTPMTLQERDLMLAALQRLAENEVELLLQRRLLRLHKASEARIKDLVRDGLAPLREGLGDRKPSEQELDAAQRARERLARTLAGARSGKAVAAATLAFVHDAMTLARGSGKR